MNRRDYMLTKIKASMAAREIHPVGGKCSKCQHGSQEICTEYWGIYQEELKKRGIDAGDQETP